MAQIDDRVFALEQRMDNLTKWVVYWNGEKYCYCNLEYARKNDIYYDSTYECAYDAREAANALNNQ